jgi:hypothetical protein
MRTSGNVLWFDIGHSGSWTINPDCLPSSKQPTAQQVKEAKQAKYCDDPTCKFRQAEIGKVETF